MPEMTPPPMSYNLKPDKQIRAKVSWKIGKTEEEEKLPVYDDTSNEDLLRTENSYQILASDPRKSQAARG